MTLAKKLSDFRIFTQYLFTISIPPTYYDTIGPCPVMPRDTLPMIVSCSPTLEQDYMYTAFRWHEDNRLSTERPAASGTGVQELRSCGHKSVEQFAGGLMKSRVIILPVQAVAEDIFILFG